MKRTTRRELIVAATATAMASAVPPAYGRLLNRRVQVGEGSFKDGVASGEPSATAVTLWSRLDTDAPRSGARLIVARDAGLRDVVAVSRVPTGRSVGYTLKARVGGLQPLTQYYYAWESSNHLSEVGRTRTLPPAGSMQPVRIAFSSCQHYNYGFYPAHASAAAEPLDLYLFLGDYIYERGRVPDQHVREDRIDAVDLATYRRKYRVYRSDPNLRELHRLQPIVHIWDDHEVEDNYTDNNPAPAPAQRAAGYRAAFEWLPKMASHSDRYRIYRRFSIGGLVDVFLLDDRQYRTGWNDGQPRHMLGDAQMQWLIRGLQRSRATWKLIANQVTVAQAAFGAGTDNWDGAPEDRAQLLGAIEAAGVRNVVFLTGDAHVFMCSLLASDFEQLARDPNRVPAAVEYVGGSLTSPGGNRTEVEQQQAAPWNRQYNAQLHGYALMQMDPQNLLTEYRYADVTNPAAPTVPFERFTQPAGANDVSRQSLLPPTGV